ncbi:MAG: type II secretion system protein [Pseudomonadota bacterium]
MRRTRRDEQGFALIEVLIAAAIGAMVLAVSATAISTALRAQGRAAAKELRLLEAENLLARIEAGMPLTELTDPYPDWRATASAFREPTPQDRYRMDEIRLSHAEDPRLSFSTLRIARKVERRR